MSRRVAALVAVAGMTLLTTSFGVADAVDVTFAPTSTPPPADIPAAARDAGTIPDRGSDRSGTANIEFRVVPDPSDHGSFSKLAAPRIARLDVIWWDAALFPSQRDTEQFLRRLIAEPAGSTYTHVPWAQRLPVPSLVADLKHADGARGTWHVWYAWPSVYAVYGDGRGTWWFSHWFEVGALRLSGADPVRR